MKHAAYVWAGMILCVILIIILLFKINSLRARFEVLARQTPRR